MDRPRKRIFIVAVLVLLITLLGVSTAAAADRGAWAPNTAYAVNDTVTYGGVTYYCIQAHTSLVGWEPPNVPALWGPQGSATTPPPTTPPPTTPPPGLPTPWQTQDVGAVAAAGSATYSSGTFTVRGSGADIWGAADEFRYVYQTLTGDGTITARVASQTNTNAWAKAGVMIRETTAAGSKHAMMVLTPGNGLSFQRRTATGGTSASTTGGAATAPRWVRVTRSGSTFTAYQSTNGTSWTTVGSATISMSSSVTIGLVVTSHADGTISTATFDNVSVTGGTPPPTTPPPTTPPPTTPPPTTPPPTTPPPTTPPPGGRKVIGYFTEWGIYGRNYHVKNLVTSGSAAKLTHIVYAFGNVSNGQCVMSDTYAAYDKFYDAAGSVDGVADSWDAGQLRGIFNQFRKLKVMYPHLKIVWSFGGWTYSGGFGQAAANATAFANSCYNLVHDPRWAGVFDGIDIDWEYPNACGLTCDTSGFNSYRVLMQALRQRFGTQLVTAAVTASEANIDKADYAGAAQYLDWYMVMSYDFFGAFDADGPTAPHSALSSYPGIPQQGFDTQTAIAKFRSIGVPASKLLMGIGFYGRGWRGVTQLAPGGSATGAAPGTYEAGIEDYKVLATTCPVQQTFAGTGIALCNGNWWSYDNPSTIAGKMAWMRSQNLGGAFFWEFSGDSANGALITAIYNNK